MTTNQDDEIRAENALLKLKLELDHGMQASHFAGELSPALENAWLNNVLAFEKKLSSAPMTTVFKHLGEPRFRKWDSIKMSEIRGETKRLLELMKSRNVILESLKPVDDLEYYRFITEELFHQEMMFVPGSNMILHYIYEEFRESEK